MAVLNSPLKKWKEKLSNVACDALYEAYRQIHVSEAQFACISSRDQHSAGLRPTRKPVPQLYTLPTFLQQSCSSAANLSRPYCSTLSFRLIFLRSWNTYYCSISTILKAMALQQDASSRSENLYVVLEKEGSTPNTLHGIGNCTENGTTRKLYPPTDVSISLKCRP